VLQREGPDAVARAIDQAPAYLTWLLEDLRPAEPGLESAEKRERIGKILEILKMIPDRILRYEEYRKLAAAVSVPLEVLWGGEKANPRAEKTRSTGVGTHGNTPVLSTVEAPAIERLLLRFLMGDADDNSRILSTLNDEFLTDPRVKRVVAALREAGTDAGPIDFQGQIAHLTEDERTFLSGIALDESPEPTEKDLDRLFKALETRHLETEGAALQKAIKLAEDEGVDFGDLVRRKEAVKKRIAQLNSRKG
jgi:DNA primase